MPQVLVVALEGGEGSIGLEAAFSGVLSGWFGKGGVFREGGLPPGILGR